MQPIRWPLLFALMGLVLGAARAAQAVEDSHLSFDDRVIKGQRRGKNSVRVFDRQRPKLPTLVQKPTHFRKRIIESVF